MKRAAKERKHTTQALMGATRLASGKDMAIYLVESVSSSLSLIHISEPTRQDRPSRMPSSA